MIASVTAINASVPIVVGYGKGRRAVMNLFTNAEDRLKHGDTAGAKRDLDAALHADPTFWPALYVRTQISAGQGKYDLAIQDCNEALRQYPGFVEGALLRARIDARLGKCAEA
jgi:Tfp pilus assembly protein PilF